MTRARMRTALAGLSGLLLLTIPSAGAAAVPEPMRTVHRYEAFFDELRAGSAELRFDRDGTEYEFVLTVRTAGVIGFLYRWRIRQGVTGRLDGGGTEGLVPGRVTQIEETRQRRSHMHWHYTDDGFVVESVDPPPNRRKAIDPRPLVPGLAPGTLDPVSAIFALARRVAADGGCGARVPVLDGRRRYDMILGRDGGPDGGLRCRVTFDRVAGFRRKRSGMGLWDKAVLLEFGPGQLRKGREKGMAMPALMEVGTPLGTLTLRLAESAP